MGTLTDKLTFQQYFNIRDHYDKAVWKKSRFHLFWLNEKVYDA